MTTRPSRYLNWTDGNASKVTAPDTSTALAGWVPGEVPPPDYVNWLTWMTDEWIQYLDQTVNADVSIYNSMPLTRLINGGSWSWNLGTSTLAWSSAFNLSIPGISDANNQAASGSATLSDGQVAYVLANIPFTTTCTTVSGLNVLTGVLEAQSIVSGQTVTGTGIPGSTTVTGPPVQQADGTYNVPISANATASATGVTVTFFGTGALSVTSATNASLLPSQTTVIIARRVGSVVYVGVNASQMLLHDGESRALMEEGYVGIYRGTAGQNLTNGQVVYVSPGTGVDSGRTTGSLYPADVGVTNGSVRSPWVGFVMTSSTTGNSCQVIMSGLVTGLTGLVAGTTYYIDPATPGGITLTRPSTANQYTAPVGVALSSTTLWVNGALSSDVAVIVATVGVGVGGGGTLSINAAASPYSVTSSNNGQILLVDTSAGPVQLNFPAPGSNTNLKVTVKDAKMNFDVNACTFHRNAAELFENLASDYVAQAPGGDWTVMTDGTNWSIVAR